MARRDYRCDACGYVAEWAWPLALGAPEVLLHAACKKRAPGVLPRMFPLYDSAPHIHVRKRIHVGNALGRAHNYTTKEYDEMAESWPTTVAEREDDERRVAMDEAKAMNAPIEVSSSEAPDAAH